jgi:hypothetical protein
MSRSSSRMTKGLPSAPWLTSHRLISAPRWGPSSPVAEMTVPVKP